MTTLNDTIRANQAALCRDTATSKMNAYMDAYTDHALESPGVMDRILADVGATPHLTPDQVMETLGHRSTERPFPFKSMTPAERRRYEALERFLCLDGHDLCDALLCGDEVEIAKLTERLAEGMPNEHDGACTCGEEHG